MKVIKYIDSKLDKKAKILLISVGLATIFSACSKSDEIPYTSPQNVTNNTTGEYSLINNGYRMKVLTLQNDSDVKNLVGYFDINDKVEFASITDKYTYDLSSLSNRREQQIYVSDI